MQMTNKPKTYIICLCNIDIFLFLEVVNNVDLQRGEHLATEHSVLYMRLGGSLLKSCLLVG